MLKRKRCLVLILARNIDSKFVEKHTIVDSYGEKQHNDLNVLWIKYDLQYVNT